MRPSGKRPFKDMDSGAVLQPRPPYLRSVGTGRSLGYTNIREEKHPSCGYLRFYVLTSRRTFMSGTESGTGLPRRNFGRIPKVFEKKVIFTLEETQPDHGTRNFSDRFFRSLCPGTAARHGPLCARHGAGVEPVPAAAVDTRQIRDRGGGRMGRADESRRRDRAILQYGQRRLVPRKRHHRHRPGFQETLYDDPQHHRAAPSGRPHGRRVFPEKGVPQLRLLRNAGYRLFGRTLPGFP